MTKNFIQVEITGLKIELCNFLLITLWRKLSRKKVITRLFATKSTLKYQIL